MLLLSNRMQNDSIEIDSKCVCLTEISKEKASLTSKNSKRKRLYASNSVFKGGGGGSFE